MRRYSPMDVNRAQTAKIEATIANAPQLPIWSSEDLSELLWSVRATASAPARRRFRKFPRSCTESKAMSRELKRRGFRFVGAQ